ncbi:hypothetical protein MHU86_22654 [Fragilaria crotonensis]|nr:hypothetical protein MHU86_22654 [Fragilaria crotonensis]
MDDVKKGGDERNVAETAADATGVDRRSGPVNGSLSATGSGSVQGVPNKRRDSICLNTNAGIQHPAAMSAVDSGPSCLICTESRADIKCSRGHALCTIFVVDKLGDDNGSQLLCLMIFVDAFLLMLSGGTLKNEPKGMHWMKGIPEWNPKLIGCYCMGREPSGAVAEVGKRVEPVLDGICASVSKSVQEMPESRLDDSRLGGQG